MNKQSTHSRRPFLQTSTLLSVGALRVPFGLEASHKVNPVILITSGWQDVNIGDIAHTPGFIALFNRFTD